MGGGWGGCFGGSPSIQVGFQVGFLFLWDPCQATPISDSSDQLQHPHVTLIRRKRRFPDGVHIHPQH